MWPINKIVAIILAVIFGPLTWIYSFRLNSWKLALSMAVILPFIAFNLYFFYITSKAPPVQSNSDFTCGEILVGPIIIWMMLSFYLPTSLWIWAILDTSLHKPQWYQNITSSKSKSVAVILAAVAGPWTWLYTYKRWDIAKWGVSLFIAFLIPYMMMRLNIWEKIAWIWGIILALIWIGAVIETSIRSKSWYEGNTINPE